MNYQEYDCKKMEDLIGKTFVSVTRGDQRIGYDNQDSILMKTADGERFLIAHMQDCCESVTIEDICGDLSDLIGSPITESEQVDGDCPAPNSEYEPDSYTWTFFKLGTAKGSVTIRFYGESNGYYSEDADLYQLSPEA